MESLPPLRRIVTGHAADGSAVIESTEIIPPQTDNPAAKAFVAAGGGNYALWNTGQTPANNQAQWDEPNDKPFPLYDPSGTRLVAFDLAPGLSSARHRTISVDFVIMVAGEMVMELDGGVEVTVHAGDTVVQRGTIHTWHNRSDKPARMLAALIPSEVVSIDGKELPFEYPPPKKPRM